MTTTQGMTENEHRVLNYLKALRTNGISLWKYPAEICLPQRSPAWTRFVLKRLVARGLVEKVGGQYRATGAA